MQNNSQNHPERARGGHERQQRRCGREPASGGVTPNSGWRRERRRFQTVAQYVQWEPEVIVVRGASVSA